ncbi:MAG: hypothetical protein OER78_00835 [Nitrosopumilus sp.]|nr:hypothetical protein [Nitrosopumilus sp.]
MSKRITIVLEDAIIKKLRARQAKLIKESVGSVSFSSVVNQALRQHFK